MELGNRRASRCIDVTEGVQADQGRSGTQGGSGGGGKAAAACEGDGARSQVQGGSGAGLIHEWCGQKPHKTFTREKTQPGIVSTPRAWSIHMGQCSGTRPLPGAVSPSNRRDQAVARSNSRASLVPASVGDGRHVDYGGDQAQASS